MLLRLLILKHAKLKKLYDHHILHNGPVLRRLWGKLGVWAVAGGVHHGKVRRPSANNACTRDFPVRATGGLVLYNQTETLQRRLHAHFTLPEQAGTG